jgi:hypothetical protein
MRERKLAESADGHKVRGALLGRMRPLTELPSKTRRDLLGRMRPLTELPSKTRLYNPCESAV